MHPTSTGPHLFDTQSAIVGEFGMKSIWMAKWLLVFVLFCLVNPGCNCIMILPLQGYSGKENPQQAGSEQIIVVDARESTTPDTIEQTTDEPEPTETRTEKSPENRDAREPLAPDTPVEKEPPPEETKETPIDPCNKPNVTTNDPLQRVSQGIVGCWKGNRTTPWDGTKSVDFIFTASKSPRDEGYRFIARCLEANCAALFYGSNQDNSKNQYLVKSVTNDGSASGWIQIAGATNQNATERGSFEKIQLSQDLNTLTFEFWNTWDTPRKGPIIVKLKRTF